uniref:G_PROTEIN_RECEP_F1_2 domain-containing protein n=1 Tax=Steinernema glaseri TaxID=37863 RepID=A0A1I8AJX6_9BILA
MIFASALTVYIVTIFATIITIVLNAYILYKKLSSRQFFNNSQLQLQYYCVFFYWIFAISCLAHATYMCYALTDPNRSLDLVFWSGTSMNSTEHVVGIGNTFVAIDRLLAMVSPGKYRKIYGAILHKLYLICLPAIIVTCVVIYALNKEYRKPGNSFGLVVNREILVALNDFNAGACGCNVLLTVGFMVCFWKFLKRQNRSINSGQYRNIKKANYVVMYQMLLEIVLVIIPMAITAVFNSFGVNLIEILGPYPLTVLSLYTASCSVVYIFKLKRTTEKKPVVTTVRTVI